MQAEEGFAEFIKKQQDDTHRFLQASGGRHWQMLIRRRGRGGGSGNTAAPRAEDTAVRVTTAVPRVGVPKKSCVRSVLFPLGAHVVRLGSDRGQPLPMNTCKIGRPDNQNLPPPSFRHCTSLSDRKISN